MNKVITVEQARKITGGRTTHMPVEYENAVKALQACMTLDEAKYWSDKSDALAAWAKIYRNEEVSLKARQLKLHAFRRMGQLAEELRPSKRMLGGRKGEAPGSHSLLVESGIGAGIAVQVARLAKATPEEFERVVAAGKGVYTSAAEFRGRVASGKGVKKSSDMWHWLTLVTGGPELTRVISKLRAKDPADCGRDLSPDEVEKARKLAVELSEWLDEFEQHLPKVIK